MVFCYFNFNFIIIMVEYFSNALLLNIKIWEHKKQNSLSFFRSCWKHLRRKSDLINCITQYLKFPEVDMAAII